MKRITIPFSEKVRILKALDSKALNYVDLRYGNRIITKQQTERWRQAINQGTVKKPNLPTVTPPVFKGPTNGDVARNHELEIIRIKAKLCDAYLEIGRLEKMIAQKNIERREPNRSMQVPIQ